MPRTTIMPRLPGKRVILAQAVATSLNINVGPILDGFPVSDDGQSIGILHIHRILVYLKGRAGLSSFTITMTNAGEGGTSHLVLCKTTVATPGVYMVDALGAPMQWSGMPPGGTVNIGLAPSGGTGAMAMAMVLEYSLSAAVATYPV